MTVRYPRILFCLWLGLGIGCSKRANRPAAMTGPTNAPATAGDIAEAQAFANLFDAAETVHPDIETKFNKWYPMFQVGDSIELRLSSGVVLNGTVKAVAADALVLTGADSPHNIPFLSLSVFDRLRSDSAYRQKWTDVLAYISARKLLQQNDRRTPHLPWTNLVEMTDAADLGDVEAQTLLGLAYASGRQVEADTTIAFLYLRMAAAQNNATAQYNLGQLFWSGRGVPKNQATGIRWISMAAAQGYPPASEFLTAQRRKATASVEASGTETAEDDVIEISQAATGTLTTASTTRSPKHRKIRQTVVDGRLIYTLPSGKQYYFDAEGRRHSVGPD